MLVENHNEWSLREEILATGHRWPLVILFCLLGSLLGWGLAQVWPSPYRATVDLYVALNPYRAMEDRPVREFAQVEFNYADDFKNWQMANLKVLTSVGDVTTETLQRLRQQDEYWAGVTPEELIMRQRVYWRNPGRWRLVVEYPNAQHARQAAETWEAVVLEKIDQALRHSMDTLVLDTRLHALAEAQTAATARQASLTQARQSLAGIDRSQAAALLETTGLSTTYPDLAAALPAADAPAKEFAAWIEQLSAVLDSELASLNSQLATFEPQRAELRTQYETASQGSRGFSANLEVSRVSNDLPVVEQVRPTGLLALIGTLLGFVAWLLFWFARIALKPKAG